MTVSTSFNRELTVGQIWLDAYQLAGLYEVTQSLRDADKQRASRYSERILDTLVLYGVSARMLTFENVTLTADTYRYSLDSDIVDVVDDGMYIKAGTSDLTKAAGETIVKQTDLESWHRISAKNAESNVPTRYFTNRAGTTLAVWYWPIPQEAGTVRHKVVRALADMNDENATLDLETFWLDYVTWELAHQLAEANSVPGTKIERLRDGAQMRLRKARGWANQHAENYVVLDHRVN